MPPYTHRIIDSDEEPDDQAGQRLAPAVLVFPATHPDGMKFLDVARERGETAVAASSVWDAKFAAQLGELILLPYVHDQTFPDQFQRLVGERHVTSIYAPVAAVYSWLAHYISENRLPLRLIGDSPIKCEMARFDAVMAKAATYRPFIDQCAGGNCDLADLEIAAVFRMAGKIYGESNDDKIAAMMAIFSSAPKGDVVEVGSLVGRSAAVLAMMSRRYRTGNVLAIDPWQPGNATQCDSPDTVRVHMVGEWEYDMLPQDFVVNTWPIGLGGLNYLRLDSAAGYQAFCRSHTVANQIFGRVDYQGDISVLHIDGNHDYAQVKIDCDLWLTILASDAWLILDDYLWAHGDGPKRVGDSLLLSRKQDIERAFVCGKALFVKFGSGTKAEACSPGGQVR